MFIDEICSTHKRLRRCAPRTRSVGNGPCRPALTPDPRSHATSASSLQPNALRFCGGRARTEGTSLLRGRPQQARVRALAYRSSGLKPVCLAIRTSMRGPISSPSWKANTKSGQPSRSRVRWLPDSRLTCQPIRRNPARTRRAFAAPPTRSCRLEGQLQQLRHGFAVFHSISKRAQRECLDLERRRPDASRRTPSRREGR